MPGKLEIKALVQPSFRLMTLCRRVSSGEKIFFFTLQLPQNFTPRNEVWDSNWAYHPRISKDELACWKLLMIKWIIFKLLLMKHRFRQDGDGGRGDSNEEEAVCELKPMDWKRAPRQGSHPYPDSSIRRTQAWRPLGVSIKRKEGGCLRDYPTHGRNSQMSFTCIQLFFQVPFGGVVRPTIVSTQNNWHSDPQWEYFQFIRLYSNFSGRKDALSTQITRQHENREKSVLSTQMLMIHLHIQLEGVATIY
jgi:hypothetical protein